MDIIKLISGFIIFLFSNCSNQSPNDDSQSSGNILIKDEIQSDSTQEISSNHKIEDIQGTWVDYRLVNSTNKVNRRIVFLPASGFWIEKDKQDNKIVVNVQYFEHNYDFYFESLFFRRSGDGLYDSCFAIQNNNIRFLFIYNRKNKTIVDFQLIDSTFITDNLRYNKQYFKIENFAIFDIEQFAMGKYLLDSVINVEYKGQQYKVKKTYEGRFYKIKGLLDYSTLQLVDWKQNNGMTIEIALASKGDFEAFELIQRNDSDYLLNKLSRKLRIY